MNKNLSELDFYEQLSDSYDQMISWPNRISTEGMFFKKLVNDYKLKSYLDVACSTGFHVIMFRRLGLDAVGIDASPKMVERAKANSVTCGVTVEYILGDVATLSKRFSEGFDIITLLGDTVSDLKPRQELKRVLQEIYKCLNPGGLFVIQTRNYDYILKNRLRFMPPTGSRNGTEETFFFRLLDFYPKSIDYSVVKFRWHENRWDSSVQTTEIHPYLRKDLEGLLEVVGFEKLSVYRNYNFEDYDPNGLDLIFLAEKKGVLKAKAAATLKRERLSKRIEPVFSEKPKKGLSSAPPLPVRRRGRPPKASKH